MIDDGGSRRNYKTHRPIFQDRASPDRDSPWGYSQLPSAVCADGRHRKKHVGKIFGFGSPASDLRHRTSTGTIRRWKAHKNKSDIFSRSSCPQIFGFISPASKLAVSIVNCVSWWKAQKSPNGRFSAPDVRL